jgi:erythronate-4-phosphate dehydrogenase
METTMLDVWENEPNIDTELLEMVDIGTPHIAGYSLDGKIAGMIMMYEAVCKYFGLRAKYGGIEDFLPKSAVPRLKINPNNGSDEDVLRGAVEKIYKISEDDTNLRQILNMPAESRGRYFDELRKNYPIRREFQNTRMEFTAESTGNLSKKLKGIGFTIKGEK